MATLIHIHDVSFCQDDAAAMAAAVAAAFDPIATVHTARVKFDSQEPARTTYQTLYAKIGPISMLAAVTHLFLKIGPICGQLFRGPD